jgi:hypothetical protein
MDEVAHRQLLDAVQFLLRAGGDRGPICSLVTADACLGSSETYLNERGPKSSMLEQCVRLNLEIAQSESRRRRSELDK